MIVFDAVSMVYGDKAALNDISFFIEPGEFVFLVGPSGAGKSTVAKLLIREIVPTQGHISVGDYDFGRIRRKDIPYLRRQIGMVFQDNKLLPDRTAAENIALPLEILGKSDSAIVATVSELLKATGLEGKDNYFPRQLSGGELQRVVIARALAMDPAVLFADEPTGNLDDHTAGQIIELLERINQQGTTVIMSTHDMTMVRKMKKRINEIGNGTLVSDSNPKSKKHETKDKDKEQV
jgi:cell division transport system ATP-binding protein